MSYEIGDIVIVYVKGRNYKCIVHSFRSESLVLVTDIVDKNIIYSVKKVYKEHHNYIIGPYSPLTEALYL